jgi:cell division protease FtsH
VQKNRNLFIILNLVVLVVLGWAALNVVQTVTAERVTWTEAKAKVADGQVTEVIFDGPWKVTLLLEPEELDGHPIPETFYRVEADDEAFIALLEEQGVSYSAAAPSSCDGSGEGGGMSMLLPIGLLVVMWVMLSRRDGGAQSGVANFGKSSAKLAPEEGTGVAFTDVAGIDEAIEELEEIVLFLKTPEKFTALGGKIPKGVLLVGPPGTGKTLLARAVAGEAGVPFFATTGSDFVEMYVGVGAARVRDLFKKATEHAPCIIFIDEIDAVGRSREGAGPMGSADERHQTLNQILVEMDGFDGRKGVIILGATNRPEILDPALLRAGRFDRQVLVDRPDVRGREAILRIHAKDLKLSPDVDLAEIARMTPGFAGADLANALNEGALLAARHDHTAVEMSHISDAIERTVAGLEKKSRRLNPKEKRVVAYHEAGHAICAAACPGADPVQKISIIPRGIGALGYTMQTPLEDRYLMFRQELLNRLIVLYGGRTAEELVFGDYTTGASDDIRKASDLARRMVAQYGMSESMGAIDYGGERRNPFGMGGSAGRDIPVGEATAQQLDAESRRLLETAWGQARSVLTDHRDLMDRMSEHLLENEVLERDVLATFLAEVTPLELNGGFQEWLASEPASPAAAVGSDAGDVDTLDGGAVDGDTQNAAPLDGDTHDHDAVAAPPALSDPDDTATDDPDTDDPDTA